MKRRLFTLLSALSLLLFVAVVVLWVRSHWTLDYFSQSDGRTLRAFVSERGGFGYNELTVPQGTWEWRYGRAAAQTDRVPETRLQRWLGVGWQDDPVTFRGAIYRDRGWWVAYRTLATLLAVLPTIWLVRWGRGRRRRSGMECAHCGYDLRATPGRCPECGVEPR